MPKARDASQHINETKHSSTKPQTKNGGFRYLHIKVLPTMERAVPEFSRTQLLDAYKVSGIRLVLVPHMSESDRMDEDDIVNVRTNVGVAGELWILLRSITCRYNEYQEDKDCVIADLLRTKSCRTIIR